MSALRVNVRVKPTLTDFAKSAAARHGLEISDLKGARRFPNMVLARKELVWNARMNGYGNTFIGEFLNRNHSSIRHLCKEMGI